MVCADRGSKRVRDSIFIYKHTHTNATETTVFEGTTSPPILLNDKTKKYDR